MTNEQPDRSIVPLARVPNEIEAALIVAALEEHGIQSTMTGDLTAGFRAEAPGDVQVLVADEDLTDARMILAGVRNDPDSWSDIEDIDLNDV